MHIQIMLFDGPRSREEVAASERAGRERIEPLVQAHPGLRERLLGGLRAVGPEGAECVISIARDEAALDELGRLVMSSELLPGEDVALLPGPDRVERFAAVHAFGSLAGPLAELAR